MSETKYDRRAFMGYFSSVGLGSTLFPGVLWAQAAQGTDITKDVVMAAEKIAGISFTDEERTAIASSLGNLRTAMRRLHEVKLDYTVPPSMIFDPLPPGASLPAKKKVPMVRATIPVMARPGSLDELAYLTVAELSQLVKGRKVKPSELTDMYLSRLKRFDGQLHNVVSLTEERAREQARTMDSEIAAGKYRGPLHGIPWGAKDLLAVKGYKTTWGASPWKDTQYDYDAEVVTRLDKAGAILVAKLTLGALAQGDRWYGETTRNPWNPATGASGSSAGPGSATAAGSVGFSIGTETQGSITSPSRVNGVTGHRPTFGRVPRTGAMALSYSMDKIGPMCRSAEDCALVFDAIQGPDLQDRSVKEYPFNWNARLALSSLRIGYVKRDFETRNQDGSVVTPNEMALAVLDVLRSAGAKLTEVTLPTEYQVSSSLTLNPECGAAFEEAALTPGKLDSMRAEPERSTWPNTFRTAQFIPAVDYINAQRVRTLLNQKWWELFQGVDVIVTPNEPLGVTNLTGTPTVVVPIGFAAQTAGGRGRGGGEAGGATPPAAAPVAMPRSIFMMGALYQDERILAVAHAYQQKTGFHRKRPPQFP